MITIKREKWALDARAISNLIVVCIGILLYLGLTHLPQVRSAVRTVLHVLAPFTGGFAIAYLLNTPVNYFERTLYGRFKHGRAFAVVTVFLLALAVIAFLLQLVLPQVADSLSQLIGNLNYYLVNLNRMVRNLTLRFHLEGDGLTNLVGAYDELIRAFTSDEMVRKITEMLGTSATELWNFGISVGTGVVGVVNGAVTAFTAIIASIYMLAGKSRLVSQLKKLIYALFPAKGVSRILSVGSKANQIFVGFINGKLIDSAIIGVLCFILNLIFRIPYNILIAVIIGATNIIPFFGPIIGAVPSLMILLIVDPWAALRFLVLVICLQQFDGNILGPKILGDSTGLSAIWVLVAIVVGGGLFGFPGMILGVPTFAVLYTLVREWVYHRLEEKGIDEEGRPLAVREEKEP